VSAWAREASNFPSQVWLAGRGPSENDLGTLLANDKAMCMVRPARLQSSDATFHAGEKNFMSKGRDEQRKDPRGEPRHHAGQGGEREHQDEVNERRADAPKREDGDRRQHDGDRQRAGHHGEREDKSSREDREDAERTQRTEPRR
jgi:hypothetical protein